MTIKNLNQNGTIQISYEKAGSQTGLPIQGLRALVENELSDAFDIEVAGEGRLIVRQDAVLRGGIPELSVFPVDGSEIFRALKSENSERPNVVDYAYARSNHTCLKSPRAEYCLYFKPQGPN